MRYSRHHSMRNKQYIEPKAEEHSNGIFSMVESFINRIFNWVFGMFDNLF